MIAESGVAFALVAAVAWGLVLFGSKRYFSEFSSETFLSVAFAVAALWYAPVSVAAAVVGRGSATLSTEVVAVVLGTIGLLTSAQYLTFKGIELGEVSYVSPITRVTPVFVVPIEIALLGEHLTPLQLAGVVVATVAVYVANYEGGGLLVPLRRAVTYTPGQLALGSALVLALLSVSQRYMLQELGVASTVWIGVKLAGAAVLLAPLGWVRAERRPIVAALPQFVVFGGVLAIAEHFIGRSFATLSASVAAPIISVQSIVAVLLGGLVLREANLRVRLLAAVTAIAGITLVALP
jgi:drug/metabolite transporter (DMT)-like permease